MRAAVVVRGGECDVIDPIVDRMAAIQLLVEAEIDATKSGNRKLTGRPVDEVTAGGIMNLEHKGMSVEAGIADSTRELNHAPFTDGLVVADLRPRINIEDFNDLGVLPD